MSIHESEAQRTRQRLHELETDRATIRLLAQQLAEVKTTIERVAIRAATEAVSQALAARDATDRDTTGIRLDRWAIAIAMVGTVASIYFNAR